MKDKGIKVDEYALYNMAAEEVLENMPFDNKDFNPRDKEECIELLQGLVGKKHLSIDWIQSAASANLSNQHTWITLDKKGRWTILAGRKKSTHNREEAVEEIKKMYKSMNKKGVTFTDKKGEVLKKIKKGQWGKSFFDKEKSKR